MGFPLLRRGGGEVLCGGVRVWLLWEDYCLFHVFAVAVEDVEVYVAFDSVDGAAVGVLPHHPLAFIAQALDVVVGNPQGVAVELGRVEVVGAELVGGVEYGCGAIVGFYVVHPCQHVLAQLGGGEVVAAFDVEYGAYVAWLELHYLAEVACLCHGVAAGGEEVVGSALYVVLTCLVEVLVEVFVDDADAFGGFDECEAHWHSVYIGVAQAVPVDFVLIVAYVDASYGACWVVDVSESSFDVEGVVDDDARDEIDEYGGKQGKKCPQGVA